MFERALTRDSDAQAPVEPADTPPVVVIGAACFDIKGRAFDRVNSGSSTPGLVRVSLGGTARNIAENLARLDVPVRLLTALGADRQGEQLAEQTRAAGVLLDDDLVVVDPSLSTGSYVALMNDEGQLVAGIDDTRALRAVTPRMLHRWHAAIRDSSLVVADANLRPQTLRALLEMCCRFGVRVCLDPVSIELAHRIVPHLGGLLLVTPNMAEASVLAGLPVTGRDDALVAAKALHEAGPEVVVVTMAHGGAVFASAAASGHIPALETDVVDATGAGDALTAGVLFGLLNDFPLDDAIALGTSMASLTMQSTETVRSDLTLDRVYQHLKL